MNWEKLIKAVKWMCCNLIDDAKAENIARKLSVTEQFEYIRAYDDDMESKGVVC